MEYNESVTNITKMIITSPQRLIREEDLRNLCVGFDFEDILSEVYVNLKNIGFDFFFRDLRSMEANQCPSSS